MNQRMIAGPPYIDPAEFEGCDGLMDYIRDMAVDEPVDGKCVTWCPFRDAFGLCGYRWPNCKLMRMMGEQ